MTYTEIKERKKKKYFYRVLSVRKGAKVSKKRKYLGVNLLNEELREKRKTGRLISIIMMPEENENNSFVLLINPEFENLILHNVDSSFSSQIIGKRLVMMRVKNNFIDFVVNNFSQKRVFSSSFVNLLITNISESEFVIHFLESNSLKNSSAELYILPVASFNDFFNNSICSGLGGNSSTGCQSICSQNSQSSSVTFLVFMNLSNMSFFINLITDFANNSESNFIELSDLNNISSMKMPKEEDYKKL